MYLNVMKGLACGLNDFVTNVSVLVNDLDLEDLKVQLDLLITLKLKYKIQVKTTAS